LDDRAALVRANFIEARLDHRRTFTEINERVIAPFEKGWIGALIRGRDAFKGETSAAAAVDTVYRDTAAARAGLKVGDIIVSVNGKPVADRVELAAEIQKYKPGTTVRLGVKSGEETRDAQLTIPEPEIGTRSRARPRRPRRWTPSTATRRRPGPGSRWGTSSCRSTGSRWRTGWSWRRRSRSTSPGRPSGSA